MANTTPFTRSQLARRRSAKNKGYELGCKKFPEERYKIFYTHITKRSFIFEENCIKDGFNVELLPY